MFDGDQRFYVPRRPAECLALARLRVRQRRAGLAVLLALSGGSAIVTGAIALGARLGQLVARQLLPGAVMWTAMTVVALAIVGASTLTWFLRLRRLVHCQELSNDRPHLHRRHPRVLRRRHGLHKRLRTAVRRAS